MAVTSGWVTNGTAGTVGNDQASNNSSGLTILPSGYRDFDGTFVGIGNYGNSWSASGSGASNAWYRLIRSAAGTVGRYSYYKQSGFAVRCLKD